MFADIPLLFGIVFSMYIGTKVIILVLRTLNL